VCVPDGTTQLLCTVQEEVEGKEDTSGVRRKPILNEREIKAAISITDLDESLPEKAGEDMPTAKGRDGNGRTR